MSKEIIIGGIAILFLLVLLVGCGGYKKLLTQVPDVEFESFTYHRAGNVTSATITATGAKLAGDVLTVDDLTITADYGPFVNFNINMKGYRRDLSNVPIPKDK